MSLSFFFFNDTATTEIYTLSLHDALPISPAIPAGGMRRVGARVIRAGQSPNAATPHALTCCLRGRHKAATDRKSTRLNSSHGYISYAVFCLKKKKRKRMPTI